jgi:TonB family protein
MNKVSGNERRLLTMSLKSIALWIGLLLFISGSIVFGQESDRSIRNQLEKDVKDKIVMIRNFYAGDSLHYDAEGKLLSDAQPGAWTVNGILKPNRIRLSKQSIEIRGNRLFWFYDYAKNKPDMIISDKNLTISIKRPSGYSSISEIGKLVSRIFYTADEPLAEYVPEYWKHLVQTKFELNVDRAKEITNEPSVARGDTEPPRILSSPQPVFTPEARWMLLAGIVLLRGIVDEEGKVSVEEILRPLGAGLDDNAVKALETWELTPAIRDGSPVKVTIIIEVSFNDRSLESRRIEDDRKSHDNY